MNLHTIIVWVEEYSPTLNCLSEYNDVDSFDMWTGKSDYIFHDSFVLFSFLRYLLYRVYWEESFNNLKLVFFSSMEEDGMHLFN